MNSRAGYAILERPGRWRHRDASIENCRRTTHFYSNAESIFGYPASEAIGQTPDILIPVGLVASHRLASRWQG
ncbi:MAG TPA: hypothetical protein QGG37_03905 [Chloroflexota bacterium]|nr:hypothetical protein [Chloroflexota bacterium]